MRRQSSLRIPGRSVSVSDVSIVLIPIPFIAVGVWMVRAPWRFKFVQWLGEDGIARIGWFSVVFLVLGAVSLAWVIARDQGWVPLLYARTSAGHTRIGPLIPILTGRGVLVAKGEEVKITPAHMVIHDSGRSSARAFHWYLATSRQQVTLATTFEPSPEHRQSVATWLAGLGLTPNVIDDPN